MFNIVQSSSTKFQENAPHQNYFRLSMTVQQQEQEVTPMRPSQVNVVSTLSFGGWAGTGWDT